MTGYNVCVFCASSRNSPQMWLAAAREFGAGLASRGIGIVYGGAAIGMMGALAEGALKEGGHVTGVIPEWLKIKEVAHDGLTRLIVTRDMHERKMTMFDLADAFVSMPGGLGTLEETLEIITWKQLGIHIKPIYILNMDRYYDPLLSQIEAGTAANLIKKEATRLWETRTQVQNLLDAIGGLLPAQD